jgi:hypothetical protein
MQIDSIVFMLCIVGLVALGMATAILNIPPDRLAIIQAIINILAVVLGAAGYARVRRFLNERKTSQ